MNTEKKLVPILRFSEFNKEEWKEYKLGDIAQLYKGKGLPKNDVSEKGTIPCIRYGELYTHYKEVIDKVTSYTDLPIDDLFMSKANDVIIPSSGETKEDIATASCVLHDNVALGGDINVIRTSNNGVFLSYYLNNVKKHDIAKIAQGISIIHLYNEQLRNLSVELPDLEEQQKIAECLSSIDSYISSINEKVEQLNAHKKSLMQKLFPQKAQTAPEFRFPEFEKDGSWEEKELGELIVEIAEYTSRGNNVPLYSLTIEDGVSPKTDRYERNFLVKKEGDNFKVVHPDDFVSNPMNLRFGAIGYNKESFKVCVSGYYDVFRFKDKGTSSFWINYMKSNWALDMYDRIAIGSLYEKRRVHFSNLLKMKLLVPRYSERLKISKYLSSMDELINRYLEKASLLEQHKNGLMQQLFPKV